MNSVKIIIAVLLLVTSCTSKSKKENVLISSEEIVIPSTEKNRNDIRFQLKNGLLFYNKLVFSGIVKKKYDEGTLKSTSEYYKGKRQGKFVGFYINGNKWFERNYLNGLKAGIHKGWHQDKTPMFEYHFNNKGVYNGSVKDWFSNGILAKNFNFIDGEEAGSQKMWDLNGKIRANFYTVNGERHGLIGLKKCVSVIHDKKAILK